MKLETPQFETPKSQNQTSATKHNKVKTKPRKEVSKERGNIYLGNTETDLSVNQVKEDIKAPSGEILNKPLKRVNPPTPRSESGSEKKAYGEYKNVFLTDEELNKLKSELTDADDWIQRMSHGIEMKGYKYKNHYLAIKQWKRNEQKDLYEKHGVNSAHPDYGHEVERKPEVINRKVVRFEDYDPSVDYGENVDVQF